MTTKQIYEEYLIPQNLQEHMLRVASLSKIIINHWTGSKLDGEAIVQACLFHDIAKPMDFDLDKQAQFGMSFAEIDNLDTLQKRLKSSYSDNEHQATIEICKEIGCDLKAVDIVNNLEWNSIPSLLEKNDLESLIPIYCDMRIGPKGVLTLQQRLNDLRTRAGKSGHEQNGIYLEQVISQNTSIDLAAITNNEINQNFSELENSNFS